MKILVVDDDRAVRDALRRALTLADYDVQVAEDGEAAIAALSVADPDAVVLDVGLPGIDGLEVCRAPSPRRQPRADPDPRQPAMRSTTASRVSTPGPTTTWSSRSTSASSRPGCAP